MDKIGLDRRNRTIASDFFSHIAWRILSYLCEVCLWEVICYDSMIMDMRYDLCMYDEAEI